MGQLRLTLEHVGSSSQTREVKMIGNVTSVHKCLMSASKLCKDGKQEIWLNGREGGVVFPSDGPIAEGLAREYKRLEEIHGTSTVIPVYLEQGVYNVYFKLLAKEKLERDESPISENQIVFPDNAEEEEDTVEYSAEFIESIRREIGRLIEEEEEAATTDGRRTRSRSRGRGSEEDIVASDRNLPPQINHGSWQFRQVRRNLHEDTVQPSGVVRPVNSRTQRTLPLTAEQMREMGLKYIIPSRYAADSPMPVQEQATAGRADELESQADQRTSSESWLRTRVLDEQGQTETTLESGAREAMEAEDRSVKTEGELAVRKLWKRRQAEAEAEAILERIASEMHTSEALPTITNTSASASSDPISEKDTVHKYRARVEETMRNAGLQGWRSRLPESMGQEVRLRNKYWPHLPLGAAGFGRAGDATGADTERPARDRGQPSGHPTQP